MTADAVDLLYKMLEVDHSQRITAKDALNHPYLISEIIQSDIDNKNINENNKEKN